MKKIAIIGAGFVGATAAYALLIHQLAYEIVLIDINREKAQGEALDLCHGLQFLDSGKVSYSGSYSACKGAELVIITAGAHQKQEQTRLDLIKTNAAIYRELIPGIAEFNKECILLVVSNPVDILTYLALKLSGFPRHRVFGTGTILDTARLRYLIGRQCSVNPNAVHAFVLGEHGDSEFPVWSSASIAGIPLRDMQGFTTQVQQDIFRRTKGAAYEIIAKKGATYYAISLAIVRLVQAIASDQDTVLPVSTLLDRYHGVGNVCLSVPCVIGRKGIKKVLVMPLNAQERSGLRKSAGILKGYLKRVG